MASRADDDDDGTCAVCLTPTRDPRRVPCGNGHVFCLSCLQGLVAHAKTVHGSTFLCPCCRNRVTVPPGGVDSFPTAAETEAGSGPSDSSRPAARHRPKSSSAPRGYGRPRYPPRSYRPVREDRGPFGFRGREDVYNGGRRGPLLPFPDHGRPVNNPFYPVAGDRFDLQMDSQGPPSRQDEARPGMPFNGRFPRRQENPFALSSILSGAQSSLSSELYHDPRAGPDPDPETMSWADRRRMGRDRHRFGQGAGRRHPGHFASSSGDLDMDEVLLVIAQMEQEDQLAAACRDGEETLKMEHAVAQSEQDQYEHEMMNLQSAASQGQQMQEERLNVQTAIARSEQEVEDGLNLQMAVARSEQEEQEGLNLQIAVARSEQEEQEGLNLQMALSLSEQEEQHNVEMQFQEDCLKALHLH